MSDDLVSEEMEEDIISELPCTLAIEDSTQDSTGPNETDQVSFLSFFLVKSKSLLEENICAMIVELTLHHMSQ